MTDTITYTCPRCGHTYASPWGPALASCPRCGAAQLVTVDVSDLEPDAVRVVEMIVDRLRMGKHTYGPLAINADGRDWLRETLAEHLDATAYLTVAVLKLIEERDARRGRDGNGEGI